MKFFSSKTASLRGSSYQNGPGALKLQVYPILIGNKIVIEKLTPDAQ